MFALEDIEETFKTRFAYALSSEFPNDPQIYTKKKIYRNEKELKKSRGMINKAKNLIPILLQMVDDGKVAMRPAVELSYLPENIQDKIADCILKEDATPSHDQAIRMRKLDKEGLLTEKAIDEIMHELKPNQTERISLPEDKFK